MSERKMATIRMIDAIDPIVDADAIVVATIGGWKVVVKKDEFEVGCLAVYCEIDSWIPDTVAPFLSKGKTPRVYNGVPGEKLRTVRLRKQVSQGLLLPLSVLGKSEEIFSIGTGCIGADVTELLGIQKYDAPLPACLSGDAKGLFPQFIPKTDQERIQNLSNEFNAWKDKGYTWQVTEKCEGTSFTAYMYDLDFNVCSRNLTLKEDQNNTLCKLATRYDLRNKLVALCRNLAIQGEIIGPGIQGNIYQLSDHMLAVFDIYDIDRRTYLSPSETQVLIVQLGLTSVPVLNSEYVFSDKTVTELLSFAEGHSVMGMIGCEREGLVFKCNEIRASFKVISNRYLLQR